MNHPIATKRQEMTAAERDMMEKVEVHVRAVFGGYESSLIHVETEREYAHSRIRDTMLASYLDGEDLFFKELDKRIADKAHEDRMTDGVEHKGDRGDA